MTRALPSLALPLPLDVLRTAIVGGCAIALILADRALPLLGQ